MNVTIQAVKAFPQTFHISTFNTLVHFKTSIRALIPIAIGKAMKAYFQAQVKLAPVVHPPSTAVKLIPVFSANPLAAGETFSSKKLTTRFIPANATPKISAELKASLNFIRATSPIINIKIGTNTLAPISKIYWITLTRISIKVISFQILYFSSALISFSSSSSCPIPVKNLIPSNFGILNSSVPPGVIEI